MKTLKNQIIIFTLITLFSTYIMGYFVWKQGGLGSTLSLFQMYIPALVVLLLYKFYIKKPIFKKGDLGLNFKGLKYWIIVPLLITLLSLLTYGISYFFNPEMFDSKANIISGLETKGLYFESITLGMIIIVFLNGIIGSILNIPMFIGEELGWRGFLTPRLIKIFNPSKAFLISAIIWALWHAVMIIQGLNYPSVHPALGILFMIIICVPLGIINQYFYFKSKSIIVAALAHAALNKSVMTASFLLNGESYDTVLYGPTGIVGLLVFGITATLLYAKIDWKKENILTNKNIES
jgi:membrane protease YdiL (CAAX protease family)